MNERILGVMSLLVLMGALPQCTSSARRIAPRVFQETVVVCGLGQDASSAIADAHRAALESSLGAFVDTRVRLENDQVFEDIITVSAGYIEATEVLDQTVDPDGIVRVTVRVRLAGNLLKSKVEEAKTSIGSIDGKNLATRLASKANVERVAQRLIIEHHDRGVPDVLDFKVVGEPSVVRREEEKVWVGVTVRATPNLPAIRQYNDYLRGIAEAVSTRQIASAWPDAFGINTRFYDENRSYLRKDMARYASLSRDSHVYPSSIEPDTDSLGLWAYFGYDQGEVPTCERGLGVVAFPQPGSWVTKLDTYSMPIGVAAAFLVGAATGGRLTISLADEQGKVLSGCSIPTTWSLEQVGDTMWSPDSSVTVMKDEAGVGWAVFESQSLGAGGSAGLSLGSFGKALNVNSELTEYVKDYLGETVLVSCFGGNPIWGFASDSRLLVGDFFELRVAVPIDFDKLGVVSQVDCRQSTKRRSHADLLRRVNAALAQALKESEGR